MSNLARRIATLALPSRHLLACDPSRDIPLHEMMMPVGNVVRPNPGAIVALCIQSPLAFVRSLICLDGNVAGLLLVAPSLPPPAVADLMRQVQADHVVSDRVDLAGATKPSDVCGSFGRAQSSIGTSTIWFMTTSGTTGIPKIAAHMLDGLSRSVRSPRVGARPIWGSPYELSRFAAIQVLLQSLLGGGTLLVQHPDTPLAERIAFLVQRGCTHLSATPTFWRKLLMLPGAEALPLRQITLGGEIADQSGSVRSRRATPPRAEPTSMHRPRLELDFPSATV